MSTGIKKTNEQIRQKMSLDDYEKPESDTIRTSKNIENLENKKSERITTYLTEDARFYLNELYISSLRAKSKRDRSDIINEALKLLFEKEIGTKTFSN